jgi:amidase
LNQAEYVRYDGLGLADLIRRKELRPVEALELAMAQIERTQPRINAVCWPRFEEARARALAMEVETSSAPYHGVPLLLKDFLLEAKGFTLTNGSRLMRDNVSTQDNGQAMRLREAGFNFFARTTSPEMAANCTTESIVYGGATRNPWDVTRIAGGSSGGAAAAVAAGVSPLAHASDGGGSIRNPASCCGLFGMKPSRLRNPPGPNGEVWGGMGIEHLLSRSVRDSAAVLDATRGQDPWSPFSAPAFPGRYVDLVAQPLKRLRIGLIALPPSGKRPHLDCLAAVNDAAKLCAKLGHEIEETAFPATDFDGFVQAMLSIVAVGNAIGVQAATHLRGRDLAHGELEDTTSSSLEFARHTTAVDYALATGVVQRIGRCMHRLTERFDAVLMPTLTAPPVEIGTHALTRDFVEHRTNLFRLTEFLPYFNASGQPAMSVPLYWNERGLPIGVQFAAAFGREDLLFRLAGQLEAERPWLERISPMARA